MENFISSAAQGFNFRYTKIYRDKFGHICATDQGLFRIQRAEGRGQPAPSADSVVEKILFHHKIKEYLNENGLMSDGFVISAQGTPYFISGDEIFIATPAFAGPNANFADADNFLVVVAHVANMHQLLSQGNIIGGQSRAMFGNDVGRHMESLGSLKKKLLKSGKFSEFDMQFLRGYEKLAPHIATYVGTDDPLENDRYICHNLLKEENIYYEDDRIILTNFSEAGRGHYLFDLAYLIKRHIKANPTEILSLDKVLEVYCASHTSCDFDKSVFHHMLLYPDKFIKVATDYYSKKRSFAPKTYISRMEECLRTNDALLECIGLH